MVDDARSNLDRWLERYGTEPIRLGELLCDAHAVAGRTAIVHQTPTGTSRVGYAELRERSMRLAGALRDAGVVGGQPVAVMLPKSPELVVALVAIWRLGAVHVPLFTAFGPDAVGYRVSHSCATAVITDAANREKFAAVDGDGITVFCLAERDGGLRRGDHDLADASEHGDPIAGVERRCDDLMILLYTSGTTGQPKGVEVPVRALASIHSYMHYGLDVRPDDVFWNMADPGWGYGLWFAIIGPLLLGQATLLRSARFDATEVFHAILDHGVTNLTGAPTAYRSLRAEGAPPGFAERNRLRCVSSAGEPLNAELVQWSERALGTPIHDHYGQSELGMPIGFAHHPSVHRDPVPGAMGYPAPGYRIVVLDEHGREAAPGQPGQLALDHEASPLYWFRGYHRDPDRTHERFAHGPRYYLTADGARLDERGLLRFHSRTDDVISSSGYRIGPFEVESALMAHPRVAEVAVVGTPDELRGEVITAFVVTTTAVEAPDLARELQGFVKARLAAHLYPRRIVFRETLPRTPSGKIQRAALREQWQTEAMSP